MAQDSLIFNNLNLLDNILLPYSNKDINKAKDILSLFGFKDRENLVGKYLSNGEKELISFARILYEDKPIILLDEINASLDATSSKLLFDILLKLKDNHIIIFTSHNNLSDDFIKNCLILKVENKRILQEKNINHDVKVSIIENKKSNSLFEILKCNKLFYIISSCYIVISSILLLLFGNIYSSYSLNKVDFYNKPTNLINQNFNAYKKISPSFALYDLESDKFSKDSIYNYYYNILEIGNLTFNGFCSINNEYYNDNFELEKIAYKENRFPKNINEIIISSNTYQNLVNYYDNLMSKDQIDKYIFNNLLINKTFKIVGVYKSETNNVLNHIQNILLEKYQMCNEFYQSFYFKKDTIFTANYEDDFATFKIVENKYNNSKYITHKDITYLENVMLLAKEEIFSPILINKEGNYFIDNNLITILSTISPIMLISLILFILIYNYFFYFLNKKRIYLLRIIKQTRKKQIIDNMMFNVLFFSFSFLISSFVFSILLFIINQIMNNNLILKANFMNINLQAYLYLISSFIFALIINFIVTNFVLCPKKTNKILLEIKEK